MSLLTKVLRAAYKYETKFLVKQIKPLFHTFEGRDQIVKSILNEYFPLNVSEYLFGIKDKKFEPFNDLDKKRVEFLREVFTNEGKNTDKEKLIELVSSATIPDRAKDYLIFHAHPEIIPILKLAEKPGFSQQDMIASIHRPVGLVEYCRNKTIEELSYDIRVSLCNVGQVKEFVSAQVDFNEKGMYTFEDETGTFVESVPTFITVNKEYYDIVFSRLQASKTKLKETIYLWKHAVNYQGEI